MERIFQQQNYSNKNLFHDESLLTGTASEFCTRLTTIIFFLLVHRGVKWAGLTQPGSDPRGPVGTKCVSQ
ncbi:hypothetical protein MTR_3g074760 [Medicago truncatula]|uniref:Uncharacterized protein n=1 Tax=Medicago truncatula TaxID=3880 RepID=A0A072UZI7_MEDTR|nr:hypothetical protein MTR_3g074760 [Medicago truncatula]